MATIDGTFLPGEGAVFALHIAVSQAFEDWLRDTGQTVPSPLSLQALVDTGADDTIVTPSIASRLVLSPTDKVPIVDVSGRLSLRPRYDVRLQLPGGIEYGILVVESPFSCPSYPLVECLIGCDVLARGTFLYDGPNGRFRLTF